MIPGQAQQFFEAAAAQAGGGDHQIDRSLRFNRDDSANLSRTPSSETNRKTWTWSLWVKRSDLTNNLQGLFGAGVDDYDYTGLYFQDDELKVEDYPGGGIVRTEPVVLRDVSAWYHIVLAVDTTQSTAADRVKFYLNGVQLTTSGTWAQDTQTRFNKTQVHKIGKFYPSGGSNDHFTGYLAEVNFIDGQQLAPTAFGVTDDNNNWNPKVYSGSYGTNGFYLKFADNSSDAALGTDSSGNGNTWTVNNINATGLAAPSVTVVGDPTSSTDNPFGVGQGYSVDFDGNDELIFTGPGTVTGDLTVECFYKMTSGSGYNRIFSTKEDTYATEQTIIRRHNNGNLQYYFGNGTPEQQSGSISAGTWYHAAMVYDRSASTVSYYLDGSRVGTDSYSNDVPITLMVAAGGYGSENFNGKVSNARITKQALYSGASYTVPTSTLTTTSQGAVASNVTLIACHQSSTTAVEGGNTDSANIDSLIDTPTNYTADSGNNGGNYATLNSTALRVNGGTISNGNLTLTSTGSYYIESRSTIAASSFDNYSELQITTATSNSDIGFAVGDQDAWIITGGGSYLVYRESGSIIRFPGNNLIATVASFAQGDVLGAAVDSTNVKFYKNGSLLGTYAHQLTGDFFVTVMNIANNDNTVVNANFGQRPFAISSIPTGYKALCTQNLTDPAIADGSTEFDIQTYDGTGSSQTLGGLSFAADFFWRKSRSAIQYHNLVDSVRGLSNALITNGTFTEQSGQSNVSNVTSTGYDIGTEGAINTNGETYVAWLWDMGTSTVSNTDGTITSNVRVNTSAGQSIVTYTGNSTNGATVGHGLGAKPEMIILKSRTAGESWFVNYPLGTGDGYIMLQSTNGGDGSNSTVWNSTDPTSSVFTLGTSSGVNGGQNYVAYCFAPVEGFSAFGTYTGNGNADGPFVYTGMRPRWLMVKEASKSGSNWVIWDTARNTFNVAGKQLYPNLDVAEADAALPTHARLDFVSNGFKLRGSHNTFNANGETMIYAAFAEHPLKTARGR